MRREEEIDLVRKAKEGDTVAFTEIVRRHQNLVYATALQILKDPALAEDAAQEAFVTAFQSLTQTSSKIKLRDLIWTHGPKIRRKGTCAIQHIRNAYRCICLLMANVWPSCEDRLER